VDSFEVPDWLVCGEAVPLLEFPGSLVLLLDALVPAEPLELLELLVCAATHALHANSSNPVNHSFLISSSLEKFNSEVGNPLVFLRLPRSRTVSTIPGVRLRLDESVQRDKSRAHCGNQASRRSARHPNVYTTK